ncbi:MAG: zinc-binding dehydrogenase [Candidatus Aminicenantes bacterium]|nr:zinc-binding dehydrogenase [Candidatus Aminicenantes bacterium]
MKQAIMIRPGELEFRDAPVPVLGKGQVLIRVRRIGVCGSDVHVFHGKHPFTPYPVVQGHEFSGVIEKIGKGVTRLRVGTLVTATPQEVCGTCSPCRRGDYHICDRLKVRGFQAPGCAQEWFVTEEAKIVPLPASFSFEQGALVEPVAVGVHSAARAGRLAGRNVAVLGAGPIGNLVGQVARSRGAKVLITDISDFRLDVAVRCGLKSVSNANTESLAEASRRVFGKAGFDVAFECAGVEAALAAAVETIKKGGTIVLVGVYGEHPRVNLAFAQDRELALVGTLMYQYGDFLKAVRMMKAGEVVTGPLETRHFKFQDYAEAYRFIDVQADKSMKVFIDL